MIGASMNDMRTTILFMIISLVNSALMAKTMCSIPVESAMAEFKDNKALNDRLKKHQKIKTVSFDIDMDNLQSDKNNKLKLVFETIQSKKFETTYTWHNKKFSVWKVDFSKSQIFPQLFKNFLNLTQFNSKFYLRLYDRPTEKTLVNLVFDSSHCKSPSANLLTRASGL